VWYENFLLGLNSNSSSYTVNTLLSGGENADDYEV